MFPLLLTLLELDPSVLVPSRLPQSSSGVSSELLSALHFTAILSVVVMVWSLCFLFMYLGACNVLIPACINPCPVDEGEPCPRAVRWTYPEDIMPHQRHCFLLHVAQTRLVKGMYVASISQVVGARGTSAAKLMLLSCTAVAICQMQTAWMLFRIHQLLNAGHGDFLRCLLMWVAAIFLIFLGLAESALDWSTTISIKKMDQAEGHGTSGLSDTADGDAGLPSSDGPMPLNGGTLDEDVLRIPANKRAVSVYSEEDEEAGKRRLRVFHMLAAFAVIGFNFAAHYSGPECLGVKASRTSVSLGVGMFFLFCIMQWLSGANDEIIPDSLKELRAEAIANTHCPWSRPWCYCPPGFQHDPQLNPLLVRVCDCMAHSNKRSRIKCASWWFICVEIIAFTLVTGSTTVEALALSADLLPQ